MVETVEFCSEALFSRAVYREWHCPKRTVSISSLDGVQLHHCLSWHTKCCLARSLFATVDACSWLVTLVFIMFTRENTRLTHTDECGSMSNAHINWQSTGNFGSPVPSVTCCNSDQNATGFFPASGLSWTREYRRGRHLSSSLSRSFSGISRGNFSASFTREDMARLDDNASSGSRHKIMDNMLSSEKSKRLWIWTHSTTRNLMQSSLKRVWLSPSGTLHLSIATPTKMNCLVPGVTITLNIFEAPSTLSVGDYASKNNFKGFHCSNIRARTIPRESHLVWAIFRILWLTTFTASCINAKSLIRLELSAK